MATTSLFNKKNFQLEFKAEAILRHATETIEDIKRDGLHKAEVTRVFKEAEKELKLLEKNATKPEMDMLKNELTKLKEVVNKKLNDLIRSEAEKPDLFAKPKGQAMVEPASNTAPKSKRA